MLLEICGEITPERMKGWSQSKKQYPVVYVSGDRSKVQCRKEQYCIGTYDVRSMNQHKLEVVKQEMERVHVDILGISEQKWTGMGEFKDKIGMDLKKAEDLKKRWQEYRRIQNYTKKIFMTQIIRMGSLT